MRFIAIALISLVGCSGAPVATDRNPSGPGPSQESGLDAGAGDAGPGDAGTAADTIETQDTPPEPPPPIGKLIQVTVVSAEIRGRMANDEHWDGEAARGTMPAPLKHYLSQHPELADTAHTLGIPMDAPDMAERAGKSPAADPMVLVELEGMVVRSPMAPRAFNPLWDFAFQFVYGELGTHKGVRPGSMVRIHVVDYDGPDQFDAIGSMVMSTDDLLAREIHELGPFGSVNKLTLQVRALEVPDNLDAIGEVRLAVPGHPSWTDTGIDLMAGQRVVINAADEVCTKRGSDATCSGPEGQRQPSSYNLDGFKSVGHGTLVGALGDTRFVIGRGVRFVAPASGRLRLGVNDRDTRNNSGSYAVHVIISAVP